MRAQQPAEPIDRTPINGETYYLINQSDGLQMDLNADSTTSGATILEEAASFTSLSQRWAITRLANGSWEISNLMNGLCLDTMVSAGTTWAVQNPCVSNTATQEWSLTASTNGYYTIENQSSGLVLDIYQGSVAAGAQLDETTLGGAATQSQQWLLRPTFFRGVDGALLEKQEAARVSQNLTWWKDAGTPYDLLQLFKNHGVNMVRLIPSSSPPYANPSQPGCTGDLCYTQGDPPNLDEAKRAKNLGMSVELTLLFDGGNDGDSAAAIPAAWVNDSAAQLQTDVYNYVKQEIESYRIAGVMPDLVSIGDEVDTGFLGPTNTPTGNTVSVFAASSFTALQKQAMQAVKDAAADTSIGPALPPPLTCIHITPAWNLTSFFTLVNGSGIPYDVICQSYYAVYHGPLTQAQATAANPSNQPIEQPVLNAAAAAFGKPIFIIETAEHYETGFLGNDPWYPPSQVNQRQFLIDLNSVLRQVPNNLAMGMEYWDPEGVNIPNPSGGFLNADGQPNEIYTWNGLTTFDNADTSGTTNVTLPNYSAVLPAFEAVGGKFDPSLRYKLVNRATGQILESQAGSSASGASLDTATDTGTANLYQQWLIASDGDGYFRITNANSANVLDDSGASKTAGGAVVQASATGSTEQEWNVVTAGGGYFNIVNNVSGLVLDMNAGLAVQQTLGASTLSQQWQIVPVHVTTSGAPGFQISADPPTVSIVQGAQATVVLTLTPTGGYSGTTTLSCAGLPANATCAFLSSPVTFNGTDTQQTATLTISTGAAAAAPPLLLFSWRIAAWSLVFSLVAVIALVGWLSLAGSNRSDFVLCHQLPSSIHMLLLVFLACCVVSVAGCGGGGSGSSGGTQPTPPSTSTPVGTTMITVTASASGGPQNVGILVTVTQ
jgi:arabinogalactan endo-1,4-beta-galactosidase